MLWSTSCVTSYAVTAFYFLNPQRQREKEKSCQYFVGIVEVHPKAQAVLKVLCFHSTELIVLLPGWTLQSVYLKVATRLHSIPW